MPPAGDWLTWLILGGRGAGKTRAGAEWVRALATAKPPEVARIALVGETFHDAREVMIEGVSGLLTIHESGERPEWQSSRRRLVWSNGVVAQAFSAEDPEALRGPQFSAAWSDGSFLRYSCPKAANGLPAQSSAVLSDLLKPDGCIQDAFRFCPI